MLRMLNRAPCHSSIFVPRNSPQYHLELLLTEVSHSRLCYPRHCPGHLRTRPAHFRQRPSHIDKFLHIEFGHPTPKDQIQSCRQFLISPAYCRKCPCYVGERLCIELHQ
eukprot:gnl/TRDRNA2_/TRDRNA2_175252_c23_seq12.p2 gnl/TRDRNA2_/TRDRNA2_175252_c23~~gnl/TRDRNA2_/TRDRNA2_175252_c23_seq12.p2  ORF type:complete len:109 (-),score=2.46 gnl/TRDRNA2_/TRDRNA2_175252_c23_seq12:183-509(-)